MFRENKTFSNRLDYFTFQLLPCRTLSQRNQMEENIFTPQKRTWPCRRRKYILKMQKNREVLSRGRLDVDFIYRTICIVFSAVVLNVISLM